MKTLLNVVLTVCLLTSAGCLSRAGTGRLPLQPNGGNPFGPLPSPAPTPTPTPTPEPPQADSGTLNPAFGQGGSVVTAIGSRIDTGTALAIQNDNKVIAVGYSWDGDSDVALVRYLENGDLDPTFGVSGKVRADFGGTEQVYSALVQPDGKIVVAGHRHVRGVDEYQKLFLARFLSNGNVDYNFGSSGMVTLRVSEGRDIGIGLTRQNDGKLIVVGSADSGSNLVVARFHANGVPDSSFGSAGVKQIGRNGTWMKGQAVRLQNDGKIVVVGQVSVFGEVHETEMLAVRLHPNGSLDNGFGSGGMVQMSLSNYSIAVSIEIQTNGRILLAGVTYDSDGERGTEMAVVRLLSNGALDDSFARNGVQQAGFALAHCQARSLALQSDGKIVLYGSGIGFGENRSSAALVRLLPNGSIDSDFAEGGLLLVPQETGQTTGTAIVIKANGHIVGLGAAYRSDEDQVNSVFSLVEILP